MNSPNAHDPLMANEFEFVLHGIPVSQQSSNSLNRWKNEVRDAACRAMKPFSPLSVDVAVVVTYFIHSRTRNVPDVDNAAKPILDALKGLAFIDDAQVSDMICRKRYLDPQLEIRGASQLLTRTRATNRPFVHVKVAASNVRELTFP